MRALLAVLIAAVPLSAFAQRERTPIRPRDVEIARDRLEHKKAVDERHAEHLLRSDALKDAIHDFTHGDYDVAKLYATFAEFTTANGQYFVALHLAVPPELAIADDAKVTFFGVLEDSARKPRWSTEEPAALQRSRTSHYLERSLLLHPEIYSGVFGLAVDGKPVGMVTLPMDLLDVKKETRRISRLLLSNEVFVLDKAQQSLDPFCFGGVKVLPKADRTFKRKEEVWVFVESQNPKLGDDGAPRFTARVEAVSASPGVQKTLRTDALTTALPLRGVPRHYGVGTTLDISRLSPGEWKLHVSITDTLADERYELLETIRVVD